MLIKIITIQHIRRESLISKALMLMKVRKIRLIGLTGMLVPRERIKIRVMRENQLRNEMTVLRKIGGCPIMQNQTK